VEGFASPKDWRRAYEEINEFERMLTDHGTRVVKIFLHITPEEQLSRFRNRILDPTKRWKLSCEDFRNRQKWKEYEEATDKMFEDTSTSYAPWHVIPANSKKYARVTALSVIAERMSSGVDLSPVSLSDDIIQQAQEHLDIDIATLTGGTQRTD
jgi:polyphosphate kinase 2 (PPK2 family)